MANIRIDINHAPRDGEAITFKAPCDAKDITGLVIYYPSESGATASCEFTLNDANGGDIGVVDNIFAAGAIVKVILDTDVNNAYVQNPDTNTYLEGRFENKAPKSHNHDDRYYTETEIDALLQDVFGYVEDAVKNAVSADDIDAAVSEALEEAKASGEFDGEDGKDGASGVHVGSDTPPDNANVWVDISGDPSSTEEWTFTLEDGTTVEKTVVVVS